MRSALSFCSIILSRLQKGEIIKTIQKIILSELKVKEKQIIDGIVNGCHSSKWESCIQAALKSAESNKDDNYLVPAFLYLNCLNQLGSIFFNENGKKDKNPILMVLRNFVPAFCVPQNGDEAQAKLINEKLDAMRHLRNSLAHNMGLVDPMDDKKYKFILTDNADTVIQLPQNPWNEEYKEDYCWILTDKHDVSTSYQIGVPALGKMVRQILSTIEQKYNNGDLELYIPKREPNEDEESKLQRYADRLREIAYRFFVYYKKIDSTSYID